MNKQTILTGLIVLFLLTQSFFLGWYSGKNHERLYWSLRDVEFQGEMERERVRNEVLSGLVQ